MLNNYAKVTIMFDIVLNVVLNITKFNKSYPEQWKFSQPEITQVLKNQNKDIRIFIGTLFINYF